MIGINELRKKVGDKAILETITNQGIEVPLEFVTHGQIIWEQIRPEVVEEIVKFVEIDNLRKIKTDEEIISLCDLHEIEVPKLPSNPEEIWWHVIKKKIT